MGVADERLLRNQVRNNKGMSAAINVRRLESELAVALEADQRYQRENDAKFRAVHQKVATYEEFRCGTNHPLIPL